VRGYNPRGEEVWTPAQTAFSTTNLPEIEYFNVTSNGLTCGNTPEDSKLHGCEEIAERQADFTMFYKPERCFTLEPDDGPLKDALEVYKRRGIAVQFMEFETELGVPVYRCFVRLNGQLLSGSGASLNGQTAASRAFCEMNTKVIGYLMHEGAGAQRQGRHFDLENLSVGPQRVDSDRVLGSQDLPDYSTGNVQGDLTRFERLFERNGYNLVYVNMSRQELTRDGVQIPVFRVVVPGMEYPHGVPQDLFVHFMEDAWLPIPDTPPEMTDMDAWEYASRRSRVQRAAGLPAQAFKRLGGALRTDPRPERIVFRLAQTRTRKEIVETGNEMYVADAVRELHGAVFEDRDDFWRMEARPKEPPTPPQQAVRGPGRKKKKKKKKGRR